MHNEELQKKIIAAFADVPYPGNDQIGAADGRDDAEWAIETFSGKTWESIQPHELERPLIRFMTTQAFQYYLPAYLMAYDDIDSSGDTLIRMLTPLHLDDLGINKNFHSIFKNFTVEQKKAIYEFLKFEYQEILLGDPESCLLSKYNDNQSNINEKRSYQYFWRHLIDYWKEFSES